MRSDLARPRVHVPARALHRRFFPITPANPEIEPHDSAAGLYEGEPETCRRDLRRFLPVLGHLGLMLAVFKLYHLEGRAFQLLVTITLSALPIHYFLPYRWKKPFFVAISIVGLIGVFGIGPALVVLPVAAVLIGICHLPLPWLPRVGALAAVAAALAWARAGAATHGIVSNAVWPILGSMFMFRLVIYIYELKHATQREPLLDTISYFFLLPNYCFVHFPVVDYRTFRRGYFAADIHRLQRIGVRMMVRGMTHLLCYRLIYHDLLIPADAVHDLMSLLRYLVGNYLIYLRVSGQFHLACGMLHLFGFQLPATHHNYLLATGFTDYWRRINIYWKDFMVRVVFNPVAFQLKRWPQPAAVAAATVVVFVVTWALHAYQAFWLRGVWPITVPDALFWGILGALVMVNVQLELRQSHRARSRAADRSIRSLAGRAVKTLATFTTIALLWSLWSSASVGAWVAMLQRAWTGVG